MLLPLVGVVPVLLGAEATAKRTALVVTTLEFVLSLGLWWALDPSSGRLQLVSERSLDSRAGAISYRVGLDGISLVMVLLTTVAHAAQRAGELALHHPAGARRSTPSC